MTAKCGLSQNWCFPLQLAVVTLFKTDKIMGVNMSKLIDRLRDAMVALVEVIAGATLPQPKLIPIKVTADKRRR